jgi:hypothetical protein
MQLDTSNMLNKLQKMQSSNVSIPQGAYSMPAGTNGAVGAYSMMPEQANGLGGLLNNLKSKLNTPEMQQAMLKGGLGMIENAQKRKQSQQDQLLEMLGQMNPAQNLQGMQSSFGMPNMQSVNGLLGR